MRYIRSFGISLLVGLGAVAAVGTAGCADIIGADFDDKTLTGPGGAGGSGNGGTGGSTNTGGAGGSQMCSVPTECGTDSVCQHFLCSAGICSVANAPQGTDCSTEIAGGTCESAGGCSKCDGTAPDSVALLNLGNNVGKIVELVHVRNEQAIQANSTQDTVPSAQLPVCALSLQAGDLIGIVVKYNGNSNATVDLTYTALIGGSVGLRCPSETDLGGANPKQANIVQEMLKGPQATIIPATTNPETLDGNCLASGFVALYIVEVQAP